MLRIEKYCRRGSLGGLTADQIFQRFHPGQHSFAQQTALSFGSQIRSCFFQIFFRCLSGQSSFYSCCQCFRRCLIRLCKRLAGSSQLPGCRSLFLSGFQQVFFGIFHIGHSHFHIRLDIIHFNQRILISLGCLINFIFRSM